MDGVKIVAIGGSSGSMPELAEGLIMSQDRLPVRELWLIDHEEGKEKLEIAGALVKRMAEKAGARMSVHQSCDRREALSGADFVVTQIRVGQNRPSGPDVEIPLRHGMTGREAKSAGSMFNALRTIPEILNITSDIKELCPEAWLVNLTNPVGIMTEALLRYGSTHRIAGICNVPVQMKKSIAKLLNVEESRIFVRFGGLNNIVYALNVFLDGVDVTQLVLELTANPDQSMATTIKDIIPANYKQEFLKSLGVLPCPNNGYYYSPDRQPDEEEGRVEGRVEQRGARRGEESGESNAGAPWAVMSKPRGEESCGEESREEGWRGKEARGEGSRGDRSRGGESRDAYYDGSSSEKPPQPAQRKSRYPTGAAHSLIESIYTDKRDIQIVDVRNNGAIADIDNDSAAEMSCVVSKIGPIPLAIGELPVQICGLIKHIKSFERLCVEAAVEGNIDKAILALTVNPLMPSETVARKVVNEMFQSQKKYLPAFDGK